MRESLITLAFPIHGNNDVIVCNPSVRESFRGILLRLPFPQLCAFEGDECLFQPKYTTVDATNPTFLSSIWIGKKPAEVIDTRAVHQRTKKPNVIGLLLLRLMVERYGYSGAGLAFAWLVNDPKSGRLLLSPIPGSG